MWTEGGLYELVNAQDEVFVIEEDVRRARRDVHDADANLVRCARQVSRTHGASFFSIRWFARFSSTAHFQSAPGCFIINPSDPYLISKGFEKQTKSNESFQNGIDQLRTHPYDLVGVLEEIRAIKEKMRKQRALMSAGLVVHSLHSARSRVALFVRF